MKLNATIPWNPEINLEQANLVDIILSFQDGETKEFKGQLKNPQLALDYLHGIYFTATRDFQTPGCDQLIEEKIGQRTYEITVTTTDFLLLLMRHSERIQKTHYIECRNEWVTDIEYCTFWGSTDGIWKIELCDYPPASFEEEIKQTVYAMNHGSPRFNEYSNVPGMHMLRDRMTADHEFARFIETEVQPLVDAFENEEDYDYSNKEDVKRRLLEIVETVEKYQPNKK